MRRAYVGLGANLARPAAALSLACHLLARTPGVVLERTSSLFASKATRIGDPDFLNAAVRVRTALKPQALLRECLRIESELGRSTVRERHSPREVDLDLLCFSSPDEVVDTPTLCVPHALMMQRDFVLRPLMEILHQDDTKHWERKLFEAASRAPAFVSGVQAAFGKEAYSLQGPVRFVGIINVTPDSFSDGGKFATPELASERAAALVEQGCRFLDIGGESTRPGARLVTEQEELNRVLPAVEAIRKRCPNVFISVDTSKAAVAREALLAGVDCINDVTAGVGDSNLLSAVANSPYASLVLMHGRGDPSSMDSLAKYPPGRLVETVCSELLSRLEAALASGIPRWRLIVDPGLGFAKTEEQSLALLPSANAIRNALGGGVGVLVGASRKRFVRAFAQRNNKDDVDRASAAAATVASAAGADFIRAHDWSSHCSALAMGTALKKVVDIRCSG